jgi:hypothetical protein
MYIEFSLPSGSAGMAAQFTDSHISRDLQQWSNQYNISYNTKIVKYKKRVTFDHESDYSVFAMTWNPKQVAWLNYVLIEPMKTRQQ